MKKIIFFIFFLSFFYQTFAQELIFHDKITLKSGAVYVGNIILKTNEMLMIETRDGKKIQFPLEEIIATDKTSIPTENKTNLQKQSPKNGGVIYGNIELSAGLSNAYQAFTWCPSTEVSILFGKKNITEKNLLFAFGSGYILVFRSSTVEPIRFLPLFVRLQNTLYKTRISPFIGLDAGYIFGLSNGYGGGLMAKFSAGLIQKLSYKSDLYLGLYTGISSIFTTISTTNELGTFSYPNQTEMTNLGLKIAVHF